MYTTGSAHHIDDLGCGFKDLLSYMDTVEDDDLNLAFDTAEETIGEVHLLYDMEIDRDNINNDIFSIICDLTEDGNFKEVDERLNSVAHTLFMSGNVEKYEECTKQPIENCPFLLENIEVDTSLHWDTEEYMQEVDLFCREEMPPVSDNEN